jgi:hypothetical protein
MGTHPEIGEWNENQNCPSVNPFYRRAVYQ